MSVDLERVQKTNTGADAYSSSVDHKGFTTCLFNDEANGDWAGDFVIQKSIDNGTTWVTVYRTAVTAGDPPVCKDYYTCEGDIKMRVGTLNRTAGTACNLEIMSAYVPGR